MAHLEWIPIKKFGNEPIGAIGFLGGKAVAVVSFYDDADGNQDGKVSWGERIAFTLSPVSMKGMAVVEVAMQARVNLEVLSRDASFATMANNLFLNFAKGLVRDGIYAVYFSRGVKTVGKSVAVNITSNMVKQFVIRKGFEKAVKEAFNAATG